MAKKLVFADRAVTVHVLNHPNADPEKDQFGRELYDTSSQVLAPGQTVDYDLLPPYLKARLDAGEVAGLSVKSEKEVEETLKAAERLRELVGAHPAIAYTQGWDNSHSDWLVPDSVRAANLAAEGSAQPGDDALSGQAPEGEPAPVDSGAVSSAGSDLGVGPQGGVSDDTHENVAEKEAAAQLAPEKGVESTPSAEAAKKSKSDK